MRRFEPDLILCRGDWRQIYKTALRLRIPYLLIEHDVATLRDGGTVKEQRNEREMIENASGMILPSEDLIPYLASRYVLPPYRVIHLRPSGEDINFQPSRRKLLGLNLVYAGGLARRSRRRTGFGYRAYHGIFRAFMRAGWTVTLFPTCDNGTAVEEYRKIGCKIMKPKRYRDLLREMGKFQAGFLGYNKRGVPRQAFAYSQMARPNKTWDYLAAGIPTIAFNVGGLAKIIRRGGWGVILKNLKPTTIKALSKRLPRITNAMRKREVIERDSESLHSLLHEGLTYASHN